MFFSVFANTVPDATFFWHQVQPRLDKLSNWSENLISKGQLSLWNVSCFVRSWGQSVYSSDDPITNGFCSLSRFIRRKHNFSTLLSTPLRFRCPLHVTCTIFPLLVDSHDCQYVRTDGHFYVSGMNSTGRQVLMFVSCNWYRPVPHKQEVQWRSVECNQMVPLMGF